MGGVLDIDDKGIHCREAQSSFTHLSQTLVNHEHRGFSVIQNEANHFRIESGVNHIQDRTGHWNGKRKLNRCGRVRAKHSNRIIPSHPPPS